MNKQVQITEEDIFYFVNYPETLSVDKTDYINANLTRFSSQIEFYQSFNSQISAEESQQLKSEIEKRFSSPANTIRLSPTWNNAQTEVTGLRLAAASATLERKANSISFADSEQKFLIRILQTEEKRLLYFLSNVPIPPNTQLKLVLHPSNVHYIISDINEALEIYADSEIGSIDVTVMI
ncbi:MAG: hypothetical protein WCZ90_02770 [Melioribacteraceae bacterium]